MVCVFFNGHLRAVNAFQDSITKKEGSGLHDKEGTEIKINQLAEVSGLEYSNGERGRGVLLQADIMRGKKVAPEVIRRVIEHIETTYDLEVNP